MTRNDLTTATLPALRTFLKAENAYSGHLADGTRICRAKVAALRAHALAVFDAKAEAEAKAAKKAKKAKKAKAAKKAPSPAAWAKYTRNPTNASIARMLGAIASATADEQGVITLDAEALALAGVGQNWSRMSNNLLTGPEFMWCKLLAVCGYTGQSGKGLLVLTPIAEAAEAAA
jgi:hypothetical protein